MPPNCGAAGDELLATAAGADRVVRDGRVGVGVLEAGDPRRLRGFLRARTGAGEVAGDGGSAAAAGAASPLCGRGILSLAAPHAVTPSANVATTAANIGYEPIDSHRPFLLCS